MGLGDTKVNDDRIDACPHCACSLLGDPIPEKYRYHNMPDQPFYDATEPTCEERKASWRKMQEEMNTLRGIQRPIDDWCSCLPYGEATHFRREIGVEIPGVYDGILYWRCPECGWAWNRWTDPKERLFHEARWRIVNINTAIEEAEKIAPDPKNDYGG